MCCRRKQFQLFSLTQSGNFADFNSVYSEFSSTNFDIFPQIRNSDDDNNNTAQLHNIGTNRTNQKGNVEVIDPQQ